MMQVASVWIVCEQTGRWAAAIRAAFLRLANAETSPRLYETRTLDELRSELIRRPDSIALVEVRIHNLPEVLDLFAAEQHGAARHFAALLDYSAWDNDEAPSNIGSRKQWITEILREAGAQVVVDSPRRLQGLLQFRDRLASQSEVAHGVDDQSIDDLAQSVLPWQDA